MRVCGYQVRVLCAGAGQPSLVSSSIRTSNDLYFINAEPLRLIRVQKVLCVSDSVLEYQRDTAGDGSSPSREQDPHQNTSLLAVARYQHTSARKEQDEQPLNQEYLDVDPRNPASGHGPVP